RTSPCSPDTVWCGSLCNTTSMTERGKSADQLRFTASSSRSLQGVWRGPIRLGSSRSFAFAERGERAPRRPRCLWRGCGGRGREDVVRGRRLQGSEEGGGQAFRVRPPGVLATQLRQPGGVPRLLGRRKTSHRVRDGASAGLQVFGQAGQEVAVF